MEDGTKMVEENQEPTADEMQRRQELVAEALTSCDYSFTVDLGEEITDPEEPELHHVLEFEAALEAAESKIHKLTEENLWLTAKLVRAEEDVNTAFRERDARVLDEAMRAQRVDVEALRHKVNEMKKNLATVDARADERLANRVREVELERDRKIEAIQSEDRTAVAQMEAVRSGEAERVTAIKSALEEIWSFDRRDNGCAKTAMDLKKIIADILSKAFVQPK